MIDVQEILAGRKLDDADRIRHDAALRILSAHARCRLKITSVDIFAAHGRMLAEDVVATEDIPRQHNSAVDGFAFRVSDLAAAGETALRVAQTLPAGPSGAFPLESGTAARIFTGALLPPGADCVAMQEECTLQERVDGPVIIPPAGLKTGANCRRAGEDMRAGAMILKAGCRLKPADIAAAAALGRTSLAVREKLRVALFSSGDEVVRPGHPLLPGQIYDANLPMLSALGQAAFIDLSDLGAMQDSRRCTRDALLAAADRYDVIVTTGGVSFGVEDHIVGALGTIGQCHLWQLAIKPGRPFAFGQIGASIVISLPGNPVAALVCFLLYARPTLLKYGGGPFAGPERYPMPARFSIDRKKPGRREFYRGWCEYDEDGTVHAVKFTRDGSGLISGLQKANGLIEVAEDVVRVDTGMTVNFLPFSGLGL